MCGKSVHSNQRALQCDECQLWSHASCVHITDGLYRELQVQAQFSWHCPSCFFAALPTKEVSDCSTQSPIKSCDFDSIPLTVDVLEESFFGIRVIHHNVQGLHSKMNELPNGFLVVKTMMCMVLCFSKLWVKPDSPPVDVPAWFSVVYVTNSSPSWC